MSTIVKLENMNVETMMAVRNALRQRYRLEQFEVDRWRCREHTGECTLSKLGWRDLMTKLNAVKREYFRLNRYMRKNHLPAWEEYRDDKSTLYQTGQMN